MKKQSEYEQMYKYGYFLKIADEIFKIDRDKRKPYEWLYLGKSLVKISYSEVIRPFVLEQAIIALSAVKNKYKADPEWNFCLGYSYFCLNLEFEAVKYLKVAKQKNFPEADRYLKICESCLNRPVYTMSFAAKIRKAMRGLSGPAGLSGNQLEVLKNYTEPAFADKLRKVFPENSFQISGSEQVCEITFKPTSNPLLSAEVDYFISVAPKGWKVKKVYGKNYKKLTDYIMLDFKLPTVGPRSDIKCGKTSFRELLNEYYAGKSNIVNKFYREGITVGYIYFPIDKLKTEAEIKALRNDLYLFIDGYAGKDTYTFIGEAFGSEYFYIDMILWDQETVFTVASKFLEYRKIDKVMFHSFRPDAESVVLYDSQKLRMNPTEPEDKTEIEKGMELLDLDEL